MAANIRHVPPPHVRCSPCLQVYLSLMSKYSKEAFCLLVTTGCVLFIERSAISEIEEVEPKLLCTFSTFP